MNQFSIRQRPCVRHIKPTEPQQSGLLDRTVTKAKKFNLIGSLSQILLVTAVLSAWFPALADGPPGWTLDPALNRLGSEAYHPPSKSVLAIVKRLPASNVTGKAWLARYVTAELKDKNVVRVIGPAPTSNKDGTIVDGGWHAITVTKNNSDQLVIIAYGASFLNPDEVQLWTIAWNNGNEENAALTDAAFTAMMHNHNPSNKAEQSPPDAQTTPLPRANNRTNSFAISPQRGVTPEQLAGVIYDFGKSKLKFNYRTSMTIPVWSGDGVYIVLADGSSYFNPTVPPADLNRIESRRAEPGAWQSWDNVTLHTATELMPPLPRGYRLDIDVHRPSTTSTAASVRSVWRTLKLTNEGRFETSKTTISSTALDADSVYGPTTGTVSSTDKNGSFTSIKGSFVSGDGMISSQGTRSNTDNQGEHTGTYFIDGNTIELQFDNGDITRAVFGYDGKKHIVFGSTAYWIPGTY